MASLVGKSATWLVDFETKQKVIGVVTTEEVDDQGRTILGLYSQDERTMYQYRLSLEELEKYCEFFIIE